MKRAPALSLFALGLSLAALSLAALPARAHPSVSVVMDARGNVYYSDLHDVWRIAPDGTVSLAVRNVHTHELCLDAGGNLYGEHLWYEGEATDRWGHRVWRLSPDGALADVIPATEGFLTDYSFVRDASGTMYWADRPDPSDPDRPTVIRKRLPDGRVVLHATGDFRNVRWMTATPDGTLYLIDDGDLVRVTPDGRVARIARDLREEAWPGLRDLVSVSGLVKLVNLLNPRPDRHNLQGLWTDSHGNVYVAVTGGGMVKRVSPDGRVAVVARTRSRWAPTGGMIAPNGEMWLLEYAPPNAVRVRRLRADGRAIIYRAPD